MIGIYFSGTGNTKHCVQEFVRNYDGSNTIVSIEEPAIRSIIASDDFIIFGYPIYFSNLPKIVRDFINDNNDVFKNKTVFILATMGLFSGDGSGCSARLLKRYGANVIGGLHLKMPDCIGDEKALKKPLKDNKAIVRRADSKISTAVKKLKGEKPSQEGLGTLYHVAGLFGQRLWFYNKTKTYNSKLKIDRIQCTGCGNCVRSCPMKNLEIADGKAVSKGKCTMCYRCFNSCPKQSITILGKKVYEQCKFENYI